MVINFSCQWNFSVCRFRLELRFALLQLILSWNSTKTYSLYGWKFVIHTETKVQVYYCSMVVVLLLVVHPRGKYVRIGISHSSHGRNVIFNEQQWFVRRLSWDTYQSENPHRYTRKFKRSPKRAPLNWPTALLNAAIVSNLGISKAIQWCTRMGRT